MQSNRIDLQMLKYFFFFLEYLSCRNLSKEEVEEDLVNAYKQWIPKRKRTMVKLKELTSKLHEQQLHVSKSTKAGATAGTIGGILLIASLTTAPSTFGVVLAVILVGAGIGGAGGLKMFVSKVVEVTLAKLGLKEVQGAVDEDEEACTQLQEKLDNLERFVSDLRETESNSSELVKREFTTSTKENIDFSARFFRMHNQEIMIF